jgi:hypothetical protein
VLTDDPIDSDGIVSILNTIIMPNITAPNTEKGVMVHIDDCMCEDCSCNRGDIVYGSTVLLEITNTKSTMIARLLPHEARALAKELFKHTTELEELRDRGAFNDVQ